MGPPHTRLLIKTTEVPLLKNKEIPVGRRYDPYLRIPYDFLTSGLIVGAELNIREHTLPPLRPL